MNAKKLSLLVVINPNAFGAEEALPKLTEWFAENTNAILMIAHKKKDLKALLKVHGHEADRIIIWRRRRHAVEGVACAAQAEEAARSAPAWHLR
jgi:hypothetical protein